jgi:quinol monooxygenase YgiN
MIHVIATIETKPGVREALLAIMRENVPLVLAEKGCIAYAPAVDVASGLPVQPALREDVVTIVEAWESLEHLRAHLKTPHMLRYREKVKDLVQRLEVQVLQPV